MKHHLYTNCVNTIVLLCFLFFFSSTQLTAQCDSTYLDGALVVVSDGVNDELNAIGLADGVLTDKVDKDDSVTLSYDHIDADSTLCITIGYNNKKGQVNFNLNGVDYNFTNTTGFKDYEAVEYCLIITDSGPQTLIITETGKGNIKVDGSSYVACYVAVEDDGSPTVIDSLDADNSDVYVMLASKEIKIKEGSITAGGIGVWTDDGKIKIEKDPTILSYARAVDIEVKGTADFPTLLSAAPTPLSDAPGYVEDTSAEDLKIEKDEDGIIDKRYYKKVEIESGNLIIFTDAVDTVYMEELVIKDAKADEPILIQFDYPSVLIIEKKLEIGKGVIFNSNDVTGVKVYVIDGDVKVQEGAQVIATIDARQGKIDVTGKDNEEPTLMRGQFIAETIDSDKNVEWTVSVEGLIETIGPPEFVEKEDLGEVNLGHLAGLAQADSVGNTSEIASNEAYQINDEGAVLVTIIVEPGQLAAALALLESLGMTDISYSSDYDLTITGFIPCATAIDLDDNSDILKSAEVLPPPITKGEFGLAYSQGDRAMRADFVRAGFDLRGDSVKIGVISDSYGQTSNLTTATEDIANGDLPAEGVEVLRDLGNFDNPTDEGRAMLQIVHDVAPGASLAFKTGFVDPGDFAESIKALAYVANCDIIVDDVTWITESFFTDGAVAKAVDSVVADGVTYVSAAGNYGPRGYGATFVDGGPVDSIGSAELSAIYADNDSAVVHDFGNGKLQQKVRLKPGNYTFSMHWDEPVVSLDGDNGGALTDMDIYVVNTDGSLRFKINSNERGLDPNTFGHIRVGGSAAIETNMVIVKAAGSNPNPINLKYVFFRGAGVTFVDGAPTDSSTIVGQANAQGAIAVGAVLYKNTPPYGLETPTPASFSSRGGFVTEGTNRNKPDIMGPNGANTTVELGGSTEIDDDFFPNFSGTSAAAPHVAAAIALIYEARQKYLGEETTPAIADSLIKASALDMNDPISSGAGFIQPHKAIMTFANPRPVVDNYDIPGNPTIGNEEFQVNIEGDFFTETSVILFGTDTLATTLSGDTMVMATVPLFNNDSIPEMVVTNPALTSGFDGGTSRAITLGSPLKQLITITAGNYSRKYGEDNPPFVATISGYGDSLTLAQAGLDNLDINISTSVDDTTPTGIYSVNVSQGSISTAVSNLYDFVYVPGVIRIDKLTMTIIPDSIDIVYGTPITDVQYSYAYEGNISNGAALEAAINTAYRNTFNDSIGVALADDFTLRDGIYKTLRGVEDITLEQALGVVDSLLVVDTLGLIDKLRAANLIDRAGNLINISNVIDALNLIDGIHLKNGYAIISASSLVNMLDEPIDSAIKDSVGTAYGVALRDTTPIAEALNMVNAQIANKAASSIAFIRASSLIDGSNLIDRSANLIDASNLIDRLRAANLIDEADGIIDALKEINGSNLVNGYDLGNGYVLINGDRLIEKLGSANLIDVLNLIDASSLINTLNLIDRSGNLIDRSGNLIDMLKLVDNKLVVDAASLIDKLGAANLVDALREVDGIKVGEDYAIVDAASLINNLFSRGLMDASGNLIDAALNIVNGERLADNTDMETALGDITLGGTFDADAAITILQAASLKDGASLIDAVTVVDSTALIDRLRAANLIDASGNLVNALSIIDGFVTAEGDVLVNGSSLIDKLGAANLIDRAGNLIDRSGNLIDRSGNLIDRAGNLIDRAGNLIDAAGNLIDGTAFQVDAAGNLIDRSGNLINRSGNLIDRAGNLINAANLIDAASLIDIIALKDGFAQTDGSSLVNKSGLISASSIINKLRAANLIDEITLVNGLKLSDALDLVNASSVIDGSNLINTLNLIDRLGASSIVNAGSLIDASNLVNRSSNLIDRSGNLINAAGNLVNGSSIINGGNLVNGSSIVNGITGDTVLIDAAANLIDGSSNLVNNVVLRDAETGEVNDDIMGGALSIVSALDTVAIDSMFSIPILTGYSVGCHWLLPGTFFSENFEIQYNPGKVNITPATLNIDVDDKTAFYGTDQEVLLASLSSVVTGTIDGDSITIYYELENYNGDAGTYNIIATVDEPNYDVAINNATLTVNPAPLFLSWNNDINILCGETIPPLTASSIDSLRNGDAADLTYVLIDKNNLDTIYYSDQVPFALNVSTNYDISAFSNDPNYVVQLIIFSADLIVGSCNEAPVAICSSNLNISLGANECEVLITPNMIDAGSYDPDMTGTLDLSVDNPGPYGIGSYTVFLTVFDGIDSSSCWTDIIVEDKIAPVFETCDFAEVTGEWSGTIIESPTIQYQVTLDLSCVQDIEVAYTLNCSGNWTYDSFDGTTYFFTETITIDPAPIDCAPIVQSKVTPQPDGTLLVEYYFNSNPSNIVASGILTATSYEVHCNNSIIVEEDSGQCDAYVNLSIPFITDNCSSNALNFDGLDDLSTADVVIIPHSASLALTSELTLESWVYVFSAAGSWENILYKSGAGAPGYGLAVNNGKLRFWDKSNGALTPISNGSVLDEVWTHVAVTVGDGLTKFYINGELDTIYNQDSFQQATGDLLIGRQGNSSINNWTGSLDEIRIWDIVRDQVGIQSAMNGKLAGNETGLVAYYDFDQGSANGVNTGVNTLIDRTVNGNDGTLQNFALSGTSSNWTDDRNGGISFTNDKNGTADASDTYPLGTTTVTWTATDASGNIETCSYDVVVKEDLIAPYCSCAVRDSLALVALYNSTVPNLVNLLPWDLNTPYSSWDGIVVNGSGCVTQINLDNQRFLSGTIPPEIGNLTDLVYLGLFNNNLTGTLPSSFGNLVSLGGVNIADNNLSGAIPDTFTNLTGLTAFTAYSNNFDSPIPPSLENATNLSALLLSGNNFNETIPEFLGSFTNLQQLWLQANQFTGSIPDILGSLTALTDLRMWGNELSGELPASLTNLTSLTTLNLGDNQLTGCYPAGYEIFCGFGVFSPNAGLFDFTTYCSNPIQYADPFCSDTISATLVDIPTGFTTNSNSGSCDDFVNIQIPRAVDNFSSNALDFDYVNDRVIIGSDPSLDNFTELTIEAWIYKEPADNGFHNIAMKGSYGWGMAVDDAGGTPGTLRFWDQGNGAITAQSNSVVPEEQWVHVAITVSNSDSVRFYINGVADGVETLKEPIRNNTGNLYIGMQGDGCICNYWNGKMDEFRIWTDVRTAQEIFDNKDVRLSGSEQDLEILYTFDHGSSGGENQSVDEIVDLAPNDHSAVPDGFALSGTSSNFVDGRYGGVSYVNDYNGQYDATGTYPVGTTTVNWTITDGYGNVTTHDIDITVNDNEDPVVNCQDVTVQIDESGMANITVDDLAPTIYNGFINSGQSIGTNNSEGVAMGDLDGDGDLDAFVANSGQANKVWLNDGNGNFTDSGQLLGNSLSGSVELGDVDGDGDLDAFVVNGFFPNPQPNKVWLNDGSAGFTDSGQSLSNEISEDVVLGDIDGDGDLDAIVANIGNNRLWLNDGTGVFSSGQSLGGLTTYDVALGDLDTDSDLDLFFANDGAPDEVWLNVGGSFASTTQVFGNLTSLSVDLGDIDGDGDLDAFVGAKYTEGGRVYYNNGSANFSDSGQIIDQFVRNTQEVRLADIDGDNDLDAVVVSWSYDNAILLNDGNGNFTDSGQSINGGLGSVTKGLRVTDFDADGDLDIFLANSSGQANEVWINDLTLGISDNCGIASAVLDFTSFDCSDIGVKTVTVTATDVNGNIGVCNAQVTVEDTIAPVITLCPADIVQNEDVGTCGAVVTVPALVADDNCGFNISNDYNGTSDASDTYPVGTTTVIWTVADDSGNEDTCSMTVTVNEDLVQPYCSCAVRDSLALVDFYNLTNGPSWTNMTTPWDLDSSYTDWQGVATNIDGCVTTLDLYGKGVTGVFPASFSQLENMRYVNLGNNNIGGTITDDFSNMTGLEVFIINGSSISGPLPTTFGELTALRILELDGNSFSDTIPSSYDNLINITRIRLESNQLIGCYPPGFDRFCSFGINAQFQNNPGLADFTTYCDAIQNGPTVISCPSDVTVIADIGTCEKVVNYLLPSWQDACGVFTGTLVQGLGQTDPFPVGTTTVTYEYVAENGSIDSCSFDITVIDNEPPSSGDYLASTTNFDISDSTRASATEWQSFELPDSMLLNSIFADVDPGMNINMTAKLWTGNDIGTGLLASLNIGGYNGYGLGSGEPLIDKEIIDFSSSNLVLAPGFYTLEIINDAGGLGGDNITWYGRAAVPGDAPSSWSPLTFNMVVFAEFAGTCPMDTVLVADSGTCGAVYFYDMPGNEDNCGVATVTQTQGQASGTVFPVGVTENLFTIEDGSGNSRSCSFSVTVEDNEYPTIRPLKDCTDGIVGPGDFIRNNVPADQFLRIGQTFTSCTNGNVVSVSVDMSATTIAGNAELRISAGDNTLIPDYTETVSITSGAGTKTLLLATPFPVTGGQIYSFSLGSESITFGIETKNSSVTDQYESGTEFIETISSNIVQISDLVFNISIDAEELTIYLDENGNGVFDPEDLDGGSTDNCGIVDYSSISVFDCDDIGSTTALLAVEDEAGNSIEANTPILVMDTIAPTTDFVQSTLDSYSGNQQDFIITESVTIAQSFYLKTLEINIGRNFGGLPPNEGLPFKASILDANNIEKASVTDNDYFTSEDFDFTSDGLYLTPGLYKIRLDGLGTRFAWRYSGSNSGPLQYALYGSTCPPDVTLSSDPGLCGAVYTYDTPSAVDNCGTGLMVSQTSGLSSGSVFPLGATVNSFTIQDSSGNSTTCSFTVIVQGSELEQNCPNSGDVSVDLDDYLIGNGDLPVVELSASIDDSDNIVLRFTSDLPIQGEATINPSVDCDCPAGYAVIGYEGFDGNILDRFRLICANVLPGGAIGTDTVFTCFSGTGSAGNATGQIFAPSGSFLVGMDIDDVVYLPSPAIRTHLNLTGQSIAVDSILAKATNTNGQISLSTIGSGPNGNTTDVMSSSEYAPAGSVIVGMTVRASNHSSSVQFKFEPILQVISPIDTIPGSDNCGRMSVSFDTDIFDCNDGPTENVTMTITDSNGYDHICNFDVILESTNGCASIPNNDNEVELRSIEDFKVSEELALQLYPNPAQNFVQIRFEGIDTDAELRIYDAQGRRVHKRFVQKGIEGLRLDTSDGTWTSGVYIVMIDKEGERRYEKLILNK